MISLYEEVCEIAKSHNQLITNYKKDGKARKTKIEYFDKKLGFCQSYLAELNDVNVQIKAEATPQEKEDHKYFKENEYEKLKGNLVKVMDIIQKEKDEFMLTIKNTNAVNISSGDDNINDVTELLKAGGSNDDKPGNDDGNKKNDVMKLKKAGGSNVNPDDYNDDNEDDDKKPGENNWEISSEITQYNQATYYYRKKYQDFLDDYSTNSNTNLQDSYKKEIEKLWSKYDEKHDDAFFKLKIKHTSIMNSYNALRKQYWETLEKIYTKNIKQCDTNLPSVTIPMFDGDYLAWLSFRDHFLKLVHLRNDMDKVTKMNYLIAFTSGEPHNLVKSMPIGELNYDMAWETLNNRYHNTRILINKAFDKIISFSTITSNYGNEVRKMHDTINNSMHLINNLIGNGNAFDALIVHLMSKKLDMESRRLFETSLQDHHEIPSRNDFTKFLEGRFQSLEATKDNASYNYNGGRQEMKKETSRQNRLISTEPKCKLCNNVHAIRNCTEFIKMNLDQRIQTVRKLRLCENCLSPMHGTQNCTSKYNCFTCYKKHHSLIHKEYAIQQNICRNDNKPKFTNASAPPSNNYRSPQGNKNSNQGNKNYNCYVTEEKDDSNLKNPLLPTAMVRSSKNGQDEYLRAIVDPASHANFITEEAVQRLNLIKRKIQKIEISGLGVSKPEYSVQSMVTINIKPRFTSDFYMIIEALVMTKITNSLPSEYIASHDWSHIQHLNLADPNFHTPAPIDLLIGANHYNDIMCNGIRKGGKQAPLAQETELGWILTGTTAPVRTNDSITLIATLDSLDKDIRKFWEIEELQERRFTEDEKLCEEIFETTHQRREDGRYVVKLPLISTHPPIGESRTAAIARFLQMERKFSRDKELKIKYTNFIDDYHSKDHMHEATDKGCPGKTYYLPHHAVINEDSTTTKLRVVFDGSAKTSNGTSLNQIMLTGPTLQDTLVSILLRWRKHQIAFSSDIQQMFRQIKVAEEHQDYQRIIWRNDPSEKLRDYILSTVTYGTAAASYLAIKTMRQLAIDEKEKFPVASKIVLSDFYVDDCLSGKDTVEEAIHAADDLRNLMKSGGLNLRKWSSNSPDLLKHIPEEDRASGPIQLDEDKTIKALGTFWNTTEDIIEYKVNLPKQNPDTPSTKRSILSDIARLFDPIGFLSPSIISAKIFLQDLWISGVGWDDKLPQSLEVKWKNFRDQLKDLEKIRIPRWIQCSKTTKTQLHGFCDASEKAYSAAIYCRTVQENGDVKVVFITGKTKVAPIKEKSSLPRLELCGAVLLSNLMKVVQKAMEIQDVEVFAWTDSTIALSWIKGSPHRWKTFVANRVTEIQSNLDPIKWRHVRSEDNPADCASRGISPTELLNHTLWWNGPDWLKEKDQNFTAEAEYKTELEKKKITSLIIHVNEDKESMIAKYSSLLHAKRITAYCLRFIQNCRVKKDKRTTDSLRAVELYNAELAIARIAQSISFGKQISDLKNGKTLDKNSKILSFNPFIDGNNLLRVGGRLQESALTNDEKHPMILPYKSRTTNMIIENAHKNTLHGGVKQTLSFIRQKYWIMNGSKAVTKYIQRCIVCFRCNARVSQQLMGNLPAPRVNVSSPFLHTGVDYAGPFDIRMSKGRGNKSYKGYVSIFVCLSTKAIHIEVVSDLTAVAFIAAFKRFIGRRGHVSHMYSDNGSNFVLANKILQKDSEKFTKDYMDVIVEELANIGTQWHFIPPASPHYGGLWEASVKSMKHHLKRTIGETKLTFEEFNTVLIQIEACLNSRPLCPLNEDSNDLMILTPGHFLIGRALKAAPEESLLEMKLNSLTRWRFAQRLVQDFWKKWSSEYLTRLQQRPKWMKQQENIKTGDIVLIKDEQMPPTQWALGRITETHEGKDKLVRAVTVKTQNNTYKRPIVKICKLPISDNDVIGDALAIDEQTQSITKQNITTCIATTQLTKTNRQTTKGITWIFTLLILLMKIMSAEALQPAYSVTKFVNHPGLYFQDLGRLRLVNSDWNIVVYYKLDTYFSELNDLKYHVGKLEKICGLYNLDSSYHKVICQGVVKQFQYQIREKEMKNELLVTQTNGDSHRKRRGLANFVGTLANQFFGVLDEQFAINYREDIKQLEANDNYLLKLIKNQTTIAESTVNIFKESAESIRKKFIRVDHQLNYLNDLLTAKDHITHQTNISSTLSLLSTQLTLAIMNYQNQQDAILEVILASHTGKIHPLLLTPKQLKEQIKLIRHEIPTSIMIPGDETPEGLVQLYKIMTSMARIVGNYVIIDTKLPLPDREEFQIFNVIPVPTPYKEKYVYIEPSSMFLVTNLQRTLIYQMDDLDHCTSVSEYYFCRQNHPMYNRQSKISRCEMELLNHAREISTSCIIKTTKPEIVWIQLKYSNQWIFVLDQKCIINLICNNTVTTLELEGDGILHLEPGCIAKHNSVILTSQDLFKTHLTASFSPITNLSQQMGLWIEQKKSMPSGSNFTIFDPTNEIQQLEQDIGKLKDNTDRMDNFNWKEVHHFTVPYVSIILIIIFAVVLFLYQIRTRRTKKPSNVELVPLDALQKMDSLHIEQL